MISIMKQNDKETYGVISYLIDTEADVKNLPTHCAPGSTALCAETSDVYILNNKKKWVKLG